MADLDQISSMIGGLQADMRQAKQWFDRHEDADQRRFEALAAKIDALESHRDQVKGGWWVLSVIGTVAGALGGFATKWIG